MAHPERLNVPDLQVCWTTHPVLVQLTTNPIIGVQLPVLRAMNLEAWKPSGNRHLDRTRHCIHREAQTGVDDGKQDVEHLVVQGEERGERREESVRRCARRSEHKELCKERRVQGAVQGEEVCKELCDERRVQGEEIARSCARRGECKEEGGLVRG